MSGVPRVINFKQVDILLTFMESNRDIAMGRISNFNNIRKAEVIKLWEKLVQQLNSVPRGAQKTMKRWQSYWNELKYIVRRKNFESVNGRTSQTIERTVLDKRVSSILRDGWLIKIEETRKAAANEETPLERSRSPKLDTKTKSSPPPSPSSSPSPSPSLPPQSPAPSSASAPEEPDLEPTHFRLVTPERGPPRPRSRRSSSSSKRRFKHDIHRRHDPLDMSRLSQRGLLTQVLAQSRLTNAWLEQINNTLVQLVDVNNRAANMLAEHSKIKPR